MLAKHSGAIGPPVRECFLLFSENLLLFLFELLHLLLVLHFMLDRLADLLLLFLRFFIFGHQLGIVFVFLNFALFCLLKALDLFLFVVAAHPQVALGCHVG